MSSEIQPDWRIPVGSGRQRGIGIIGCGGIVSGAHLPAYATAGLDVVAVHDVDPEKARGVAAEFGIATVADSVDALLATDGVDIVDIAVPPWVQPEIVSLVAAAGKHMLCQKPLALDYETARGEVEVAESAGVLLAVNHQMRWDAAVAASRDLIARGALGAVSEAQVQVSVSTPWHLWPWLAAAPRLEVMYHSIHYQDALRSILGDPVWVTSVHGRYPEQELVTGETTTDTILEYADGSRALVAANHYNQHGEAYATLRFLGTKGMLDGTVGLMYDYPTGRPDSLALFRDGTRVADYEFDTMWIPDAFLGPMSDLMDAIETGRAPVTAGRAILGTIAVAQAAYLSAEERRSVRLDEIDRGRGLSPGASMIFSMLQRAFGDEVMEAVFSEVATVESWLRTEAALALSQADVGDLAAERGEAVAAACVIDNVDLAQLWEGTANVGYPILPLIRQVTPHIPDSASGSMHYGATTQDIMDTGMALQLAAAIDRLEELTRSLGDALAVAAEAHADTVMAARTHAQQAVPTTFGAKLATYLWQVIRLRRELAAVREAACLVSLHGAAGTSAGLGPNAFAVRARLSQRLGLGEPDGPWHVTRDGVAAFGAVASRAAAVCMRLAREIIDLARTEIAEVTETTGHHRGASSTMPQKANPIDSEAIVGMAATVIATSGALYRAMESGHERAAGEWQIEWHVLPQTAVLTAGCLRIAARLVAGLNVDAERMRANLGLERGRTLAEAYMFELAPGLGREDAHDLVYLAASASKARDIDLRDALLEVSGMAEAELPALRPEDHVGDAPAEARAAVAGWRAGPGERSGGGR